MSDLPILFNPIMFFFTSPPFNFQAADVNGDKKLDRKEYVAFSHPEDHPHIMRTPVIQSVMKSKDKNSDGRLDFQEFIGERGKDQDKVNYFATRIPTICITFLSVKKIGFISLF